MYEYILINLKKCINSTIIRYSGSSRYYSHYGFHRTEHCVPFFKRKNCEHNQVFLLTLEFLGCNTVKELSFEEPTGPTVKK
jgi:hypothetical protein